MSVSQDPLITHIKNAGRGGQRLILDNHSIQDIDLQSALPDRQVIVLKSNPAYAELGESDLDHIADGSDVTVVTMVHGDEPLDDDAFAEAVDHIDPETYFQIAVLKDCFIELSIYINKTLT